MWKKEQKKQNCNIKTYSGEFITEGTKGRILFYTNTTSHSKKFVIYPYHITIQQIKYKGSPIVSKKFVIYPLHNTRQDNTRQHKTILHNNNFKNKVHKYGRIMFTNMEERTKETKLYY